MLATLLPAGWAPIAHWRYCAPSFCSRSAPLAAFGDFDIEKAKQGLQEAVLEAVASPQQPHGGSSRTSNRDR